MSHFTRAELIRSVSASAHGIDNSPPASILPHLDFTLAGLERVRAFLGAPLIISSGYRCQELNRAVGGAPSSQHMLGQAADFTAPSFGDPQKIAGALAAARRFLGIDQLILEPAWVHISFTLTPRYQFLACKGGSYTEVV